MQIRHTYHPSKSDIVILSTHTFIQNHSLQEIPEFDIIYSIAQKFVSVLHYVLRLSIEQFSSAEANEALQFTSDKNLSMSTQSILKYWYPSIREQTRLYLGSGSMSLWYLLSFFCCMPQMKPQVGESRHSLLQAGTGGTGLSKMNYSSSQLKEPKETIAFTQPYWLRPRRTSV